MTPTSRRRSASAPAGVRDAWLHAATPRGPWTWAELKRQFRAFLPAAESKTLCATLQQWGASPEDLAPLLRLVKDITLSNAVHRAQMNRTTWAAGTARDPHYKLTREVPGVLRPLLDIVERVISDLERLIHPRAVDQLPVALGQSKPCCGRRLPGRQERSRATDD